uniref:Reverse transcriptase domain-containing protein n=1 Tax=Tanacetum cinerariifolium TaxID=118510 RepID=A0A6L2MZQ6_TANCI|nr:reverse transcriptase domain-containing protein [Tanacetum cinerariifolium]
MLKVSPWKGVICFGDRLELPEQLSRVYSTFHVSKLKKCMADEPLAIPLDEIQVDDTLNFIEEPVEIMDREVKRLKQSRILIVKVRWNSRRGPEFTWEREDQMQKKYPHLFPNSAPMADNTIELPEELKNVHNTFHVSNIKKCLSNESLVIPMKELRLDDKLSFVKEPVEIMDREVKQLKQSRILIVKVRWNSKRGPEFTWEREDEIHAEYPHLFSNITSKLASAAIFVKMGVLQRRYRCCHNPRQSLSVFIRLRRKRSRSPRHGPKDRKRKEGTVFKRLGGKDRSTSAYSSSRQQSSRYTKGFSKCEDSENGHWKSKSRKQRPREKNDDLSRPWGRKKSLPSWKQHEGGQKHNFKKGGGFRNQQRLERKQDRFTLLTKTPKEIPALEKGKFKTLPPMTTPVEKRNEMIRAEKLSHLIKELKHNSGKDQPKKKGETAAKDKPLPIWMVQTWQKVAKQKIMQSFSPNLEISFPSFGDDKGTKGPMIIEAEIGGHIIHRMYVDGGSPSKSYTNTASTGSVVRASSPHNGILGRSGLKQIQVVPSTTHGMLKFPVKGGVLTLRSSKIILIESAMVSGPEEQPLVVSKVPEERIKIAINLEHPGQTVMIGSGLTKEGRDELCELLQNNLDIFAWTPADMTGVPRMCVDFKDLNKAFPKDGYPLPEIDWKVESLCGFPFKCFLDAYKGYHQIQKAEEDEEKTAFITSQGIFRYTKMPFGLRNAGATYQRLVDKAFHKQIDRNLEVTLRKINMKLNPKKCTFRVEEGMFLGYQVNTKGIKISGKVSRKIISILQNTQKVHKKSDFLWTEEVESAFKQMKEIIAELLMLTAPVQKEELIVYLAASREVVSVILMTERGTKQMPIYFVSRALRGPKINYTSMEKLVLALLYASKRLKRPEEESPNTIMEAEEKLPVLWTLFTNGSSCVDGSGARMILTNLEGKEFTYALWFQFDATNNEAEYEALIAGLRITE